MDDSKKEEKGFSLTEKSRKILEETGLLKVKDKFNRLFEEINKEEE